VLLQIFALLERLGIEPDLDGANAGRIARVIDAANMDRDRHLADADRMNVHPSTLLEDGHLAGLADEAGRSRAPLHADGDTIALVTADAEGNAVSLIQSLFWGFGAGILEPTTGIVAQNRGACFTLEPGHPNRFAPGVRPFHTLMPVLVHDRDGLVGVPGTMGGYQQPQINLHTITRAFVGGVHPADAVAAPRWVVLGSDEGREPSVVALEPGVPEAARASLLHTAGFALTEDDSFGHAHMIRIQGGRLLAGSDPRADGSAEAG
jgi:gamma-glutamyltranspeptidase/glutathione hydrolase